MVLGDVIAMLSGTVGELAQFWAFEDLVSRFVAVKTHLTRA